MPIWRAFLEKLIFPWLVDELHATSAYLLVPVVVASDVHKDSKPVALCSLSGFDSLRIIYVSTAQ
jgi:hypothetical protein